MESVTNPTRQRGKYNENGMLPGLDNIRTARLTPVTIAIFCAVSIICSASVPAALFEILFPLSDAQAGMSAIYVVALAAAAIFAVFFSRQLSLIILGFLVYIVGASFFGSGAVPTAIISLVCTAIIYSFLVAMANKRSLATVIALPIASYLSALLVTREPLIALASLAPYLPALVMGLLTKRRAAATTVILCSSLSILLPAFLAIIVAMIVTGLDLRELTDAAKPYVVDFINSRYLAYYNDFLDSLRAIASEGGTNPDSLYNVAQVKLLIDELMRTTDYIVTELFNILLGLSVCVSFVLLQCVRSGQLSLLMFYRGHKYLTPRAFFVRMGAVASIVFILACILSLSTDAEGLGTMAAAVGDNLALMLIPGMLISGYYTVMGFMAQAVRSRNFFLVTLILIIALVFAIRFFAYILIIFAIVGAGCEIIRAARQYAKSKNGNGEQS